VRKHLCHSSPIIGRAIDAARRRVSCGMKVTAPAGIGKRRRSCPTGKLFRKTK
jgi:hypothetical protein